MRWLALVFTAALMASAVYAIGVSPPSVQLLYEPGKTYEIPVKLTNYNGFPVGVETRSEGGEKSGFSVSGPITIPASGSTFATVTYTAPAALDRPGYHTNYVFFKESYVDTQSGTFAVRTEVGVRFVLWQPYPGHYAEIVASAPSVGAGNDTVLKVLVNNLGVEPIDNGKATVRVIAPGGELRDVFTFPAIHLAGNSNQEFFSVIPSRSYPPGRYTLAAELLYAENTSRMNGSFIVGTQDIDVLSLEGPLYLDKPVNKFKVHVESLWNLPTSNVHAVFVLGGSKAETPPIGLAAFGRDALDGYWETDTSVQEGSPLAKVTVYFGEGLSKEVVLPIEVYNETPKQPLPEPEEPAFVLGLPDLLYIGLVLIIVGIILVWALGKLHKKKEGPPPPESVPPPAP